MAMMVTSLRIPEELRRQFEQLAEATGRSKNYLMTEALGQYVRQQIWQVEKIQGSLERARAGQIVPTADMDALFGRLTTPETLEQAQRDAASE